MASTRPDSGASVGFRLPRSHRIYRSDDIRELMRRGKRKRTSSLDVFFAASPASHCRFGVVVPKHRHRIVDRNRVKRRIRELARTRLLPELRGTGLELDVLVRARREAYEADFDALAIEIEQIGRRLCSSGRS